MTLFSRPKPIEFEPDEYHPVDIPIYVGSKKWGVVHTLAYEKDALNLRATKEDGSEVVIKNVYPIEVENVSVDDGQPIEISFKYDFDPVVRGQQ
jgi:hypothetical protein